MDAQSRLEQARHDMLRRQLARRGVQSRRVLEAIERVPREQFVETVEPADAYADRAISIDCGQTISQPFMVGLMTQALDLQGGERVLEIGTGSGYQTAILAELAGQVISLERHADLSRQAAERLARLGYRNVRLEVADGTRGWQAEAPYDRILVTAAASSPPPALLDQLADGGTLLIPVGDESGQVLEKIRKQGGYLQKEGLVGCRFVPLIGDEKPGPNS